ncbi:hypothetical protein EDC39_1035 [Geothermobacter ehrlichii]|uniref:Uncharacterized protein n=1 Tax=Geothermobacter ehrlichii TaxID=213224 RepID=A0A5D3WLL9_9BACT|nr:hypothetical protein [Geothermobacter ehrlichii]TYO99164.1 hypothetical protein EDC39_1035 [Geothermobacter ehrlichii]
MQRSRYEYLCAEVEAGNDAFVCHPDSNEEGIITGCVLKTGHMLVKTAQGQTRCWDFNSCKDLQHPKQGPMI